MPQFALAPSAGGTAAPSAAYHEPEAALSPWHALTGSPYHLSAWSGGHSAAAPAAPAAAQPAETGRAAAAKAEVRVNAQDAQVDHATATTKALRTAQSINDTVDRVEHDANTCVANGKDGSFVETAADGTKTTVKRAKNGDVQVQIVKGNITTTETVTTDEHGKKTIKETTADFSKDPHKPDVVTRTSVVDGTTTTITEDLDIADKGHIETKDVYSTQIGTKGMNKSVKEGFADDQATEVHEHDETILGDADHSSVSTSTTYSQNNYRVTKAKQGNQSTTWTQEVQEGDDYHSQTMYEGQPNVLIQVSRHADEATGKVTEESAVSDPVNHTVSMVGKSERTYDDQGRLVSSNSQEKDGTTTRTSTYSAKYSENADGTTSVHEETDASVATDGQPERKTVQQTDAVDTKDGRRVDNVSTEVDVGGSRVLLATSDGKQTTIEGVTASGQDIKLVLGADGMPADNDQAAIDLINNSSEARAIVSAGLDATFSGARASATGTKLLGSFADNQQHIEGTLDGLAQLGCDSGFGDRINGGGDASNLLSAIMNSDAKRVGMEAKTAVTTALKGKPIVKAMQAGFDDEAIAAMDNAPKSALMTNLGLAGSVWGAVSGGMDLYKAFNTDNALDRNDLLASAAGGLGGAALTGLALLFGPPGWAVAALSILLQLGVSWIHGMDDDIRRGHPEEAEEEYHWGPLGPFLHQYYKWQDSSEVRENPLDSPVPQTLVS